jgi:hypothetical protein
LKEDVSRPSSTLQCAQLDIGARLAQTRNRIRRAHLAHILDLFAEDSWRNVYAGKREVRPPGAPTTEPRFVGLKESRSAIGKPFATYAELTA